MSQEQKSAIESILGMTIDAFLKLNPHHMTRLLFDLRFRMKKIDLKQYQWLLLFYNEAKTKIAAQAEPMIQAVLDVFPGSRVV